MCLYIGYTCFCGKLDFRKLSKRFYTGLKFSFSKNRNKYTLTRENTFFEDFVKVQISTENKNVIRAFQNQIFCRNMCNLEQNSTKKFDFEFRRKSIFDLSFYYSNWIRNIHLKNHKLVPRCSPPKSTTNRCKILNEID